MVNIAHLIPVFPFLAFWLNIAFGRRLGRGSAYVSVGASLISTVLAILVFMGLKPGGGSYELATWITIHDHPITLGIIVDSLTVMMLLVVTIVGTLIQIYSIGYMGGDIRFSRYFAYISLFMSSMLGLVLADNLLMLYIFWEGVGLCSCLLVAFWYEKPAAAAAGVKAFVTTRIGDTGLLIGILILLATGHSLRFADMGSLPGSEILMAVAALLIFLGAMGKSAQFPLHVWLPDAMEGPTSVSALIHAATMVAAGVYLVARSYVLFAMHPLALQTVAIIGAISAIMAASIACTANDIKKVLAYSTVSQLGLMMLALGAGGFTAGTFHLMTHAFFKALLFLGAGSVIHAVHTQDIRQMGGLIHKMKITGVTFIIGALALAGIMPLSGFWSKDEIFITLWQSGNPLLFGAAVLTSFLTAFYMARVIFLTFLGEPRTETHAHESPAVMTFPLVILAVFAAGLGFIGSPWCHGAFQNFLTGGEEAVHLNYGMIVFSTALSLSGIGLAYLLIVKGFKLPGSDCPCRNWFIRLVENKYYVDELYDVVFVQTFHKICEAMKRFDQLHIDGAVNGVSTIVAFCAQAVKRLQTGLVENYLLMQAGGVLALLLFILGKLCRIF
ncbi:MAG: NADH-quinone oxidoreductase subunit L [Candidatus Omnitrophica bacterium]|nr:NADH-quinone oxidoreductase subunit L [Candidatus Omnitrophota bacterium]